MNNNWIHTFLHIKQILLLFYNSKNLTFLSTTEIVILILKKSRNFLYSERYFYIIINK